MDYVIVDKNTPTEAYNIYSSCMKAINAMFDLSCERGGQGSLEIMKFDDFCERRKKIFLGEPIREITFDQWEEALECLPPMKWHTDEHGVNKFLLVEFYSGSFTNQYAKLGDRYFTKMVDASDESTWISKEMIDEHISNARSTV